MLINKKEITKLSSDIRMAIDGKEVDFRDNREGAMSVLKDDINSLVRINREQMQKLKQERDLLTKYLSDISHQLKTPVTSMMIMTDLLEDAPKEKREEFISNIKISLSRMEWLVDTLLKMAKLDSGAVSFSLCETTAQELFYDSLRAIEILLEIKEQKAVLENDTSLCCDRRWSAEALTNLMKNASEHSPRGSILKVNSGDNPIYGWISVTDNGKGFPKEKYASAFKRFEYSENEFGYGIGLPLALSIIKGQNGDIDITEAQNGGGSTFTIKFYK